MYVWMMCETSAVAVVPAVAQRPVDFEPLCANQFHMNRFNAAPKDDLDRVKIPVW